MFKFILILTVLVPYVLHSSEAKLQKKNQQSITAIESSLLKMFGLSRRPQPSGNVHIPDIMKELYYQPHRTTRTVRSFYEENELQLQEDNTPIYFNVSSLPSVELLTDAHLRVHFTSFPSSSVQMYDVLEPATDRTEPVLRLLDSKKITSEWTTFDVLPAVERWRTGRNHGLVITHPHLHRHRRSAERKRPEVKSHLVTYADENSKGALTGRRRRNPRKHRRKQRVKNCKRQNLYVDFSDVGWNDWIVAPPGYDAYFCHGDCSFPLADHLNTTNHAIVQTLVNSVNPTIVPKACCVPTELSPISMLYVDEYDKVVLKNYQDMVVEGCGCR